MALIIILITATPLRFQCSLCFFLCYRTSADTIAVTRWVLPMLGRCAIPREAVRLLRTMGCKRPSQLHMSLVSAHVLSDGWADVRFVKNLCNSHVVYSVNLCLLINSYIFCVSHCQPFPLQVMYWVCPMMTPKPVRNCLEIWGNITWWPLCLSASTRLHLGLPAALATSQSSLTTDMVGNISGYHPRVSENYTLSKSDTEQLCKDFLPTWMSATEPWLCY